MRRRSEVVANQPAPIAVQGPNGETLITSPALPNASINQLPSSAIPPDAEAFRTGPLRKPDIKAASAPLAEELARPPALFLSANKGRGLTPDFEALVETVFAVDDPKREYEDLEQRLYIGEKRGDPGTVRKAADEAEECARRAFKLYLNAKLEQEKWLIDADQVMAEARQHAVSSLEEEKAKGDRKKQITEPDVDAKIAQLYPDEWKSQRLKRMKIKGMVDMMEKLSSLWTARCFKTGTILDSVRK